MASSQGFRATTECSYADRCITYSDSGNADRQMADASLNTPYEEASSGAPINAFQWTRFARPLGATRPRRRRSACATDVRLCQREVGLLATMVGSQAFLGRAKRCERCGYEAPVFRVAASMVCIGFLKVVPLTERWTQQQSSAAAAGAALLVLSSSHDGCRAASIDAFRWLVVSGDDADAVTNQCAPQRACDGGQPIAMLFVWSLVSMVIRLILKW